MKLHFALVLSVAVVLAFSGCKKDDSPESAKTTGLEGTWKIISINGNPPPTGYVSTLVFTSSQVTITTDLDCREVDNYSLSGDTILLTVAEVTGTQCGNSVGQQFSGRYSLSGNQLTLIATSTRVYQRI